ncbi:hypothetical protein VZT92_008008 [Zoarces viviparus]|uniref:Uncharacterized protein n=1 Tax=Zoarces viviparus TaxID=48416 RepID=A0AAW1FN62_ZOAVI
MVSLRVTASFSAFDTHHCGSPVISRRMPRPLGAIRETGYYQRSNLTRMRVWDGGKEMTTVVVGVCVGRGVLKVHDTRLNPAGGAASRLITAHTFSKHHRPEVRKPPLSCTQINSQQSPLLCMAHIPHRLWEG